MDKRQVDILLDSKDGRVVLLAAYYEKQARYVASMTDCDVNEVMAIVMTMVTAGLVDEPSVVFDKLVEVVGEEKKGTRFGLLRDKLVNALGKDGLINEDRAKALLEDSRPDGGETIT